MMDTSETYIKMCEKAGLAHTSQLGDFYMIAWGESEDDFPYGEQAIEAKAEELFSGLNREPGAISKEGWLVYFHDRDYEDWEYELLILGKHTEEVNEYATQYDNHSKVIWLPRQDQLQEMICKTKDDCYRIFVNGCYQDGNWDRLETMEQLWLAFVMKERCGKVWNGEEWVKA